MDPSPIMRLFPSRNVLECRSELMGKTSTPSCRIRDRAMKRFRLSTLMLLIVIAALGVALVLSQMRAARREAQLKARLVEAWPRVREEQLEREKLQALLEKMRTKYLEDLAIRTEAGAQRQTK